MSEVGTDGAAARPPSPAGAAWIDGRYCPVQEAAISVLDLGVTRSDACYDVVHVWDGRFYRLVDRLDRFAASLSRLRLNPGHSRTEIEGFLHGCVRHAGLREAYVSMTCTHGRLAAGSRDLRTARNTFYCYAVPFVWISSPDQQAAGASMRVSQITRIPRQSVDPSAKNYHWLDLDLALLDAYDHNAGLVVLRDLRRHERGTGLQRVRLRGRAVADTGPRDPAGRRPALGDRAGRPGRAAGARGPAYGNRLAPGGRGAGHLHRRRDHAGDPYRRQARRHRHTRGR